MRNLFITRGLPGSGKSSFLKAILKEESAYVISSDKIRMEYGALPMGKDGKYFIPQEYDSLVWKRINEILEFRMKNRLTTFIDATHYSLKYVKAYQKLCNEYDYKLSVIDFSNVPVEVCKERNREREEYKKVDDSVIDRMWETMQKENLIWPSSIEITNFRNFEKRFTFVPLNYDRFEGIVVIGDLHGCLQPLERFFEKYPFSYKYKYIFAGDYVDRGIQNKELLEYLFKLKNEPNVLFLEGNHEVWLRYYSANKLENIRSEEFKKNTMKQLEGISRKSLKSFCKKLNPFCYFQFGENKYLVTHGGTTSIPSILTNEFDLIKGVGRYSEVKDIDSTFNLLNNYRRDIISGQLIEKNVKTFSIHGHRNIYNDPILGSDNNYNLEGGIEYGKYLRAVILKKDTVYFPDIISNTEQVEIKNDIFKSPDESLLEDFKNSPLVYEKKLEGNISSFNFTKDAFFDKKWNGTTMKARGIFINTQTNKIIARSYEKFFNLDENIESSWETIKNRIKFPVGCWLKENGFLGLISYNPYNDDFFIASKSTNTSEFALFLKKYLWENGFLNPHIKKFLKENDCTILFEVCDSNFDPHIIEYKKPRVVILDVIENKASKPDFEFSANKIIELHNMDVYKWGISLKTCWGAIKSLEDLRKFCYENKETGIEGWVLRDADGFMLKIKTRYYKFWKCVRGKDLDVSRIPPAAKEGFEEEIEFLKNVDKEKYRRSNNEYNILKLISDFNDWKASK